MARAIEDEFEETYRLAVQGFGKWSGPWHDPDYRMLFYNAVDDHGEDTDTCRWQSQAPHSVTLRLPVRIGRVCSAIVVCA